MEIKVTLSLPRDEISIPVVRRICTHAMRVLGVRDGCVHDLEIALTEACANVLRHARDGDEYEVSAGIDDQLAVVEVVDTGGGFDVDGLDHPDAGPAHPDLAAESGRGIQLMRALVDQVSFCSVTDSGTRGHLEQQLEWEDDAPAERLTAYDGRAGPWTDDRRLSAAPRPARGTGSARRPGPAGDAGAGRPG